ncbi:MAG TPA: DUF5718 family protein [Fibrobacteria bacterium]|nr:DUF5718 family protein [Fibrobacteria bacterium]HOX50251.1 DUF5718 family protein [Fibrobacteria bacterium]
MKLVDGTWAGFGVAGNFAGHLEQAGEAKDFATLKASGTGPKGMFPFHLPIPGHFLSENPVSDRDLRLPSGAQVQGEPEVALVGTLDWSMGRPRFLPEAFAAFDDASIRREGAPKISVKKHWGPGSKGMSSRWVDLPHGLEAGCPLDSCRIASFLHRDGSWKAYGIDSPVLGYSVYGKVLLDWIDDRLATQADEGPLEDLPGLLERSGRPGRAVVTIGATRYTELGESTYLRAGDRFAVVVYDPAKVDAGQFGRILEGAATTEGMSLLVRKVVAG